MFMKIAGEWYEVTLNEGHKDIGNRRSTSEDKEIAAAFLHALKPGADRKAYAKLKRKWKREKEKFRAEFQGLVAQLGDGDLTENQFMQRCRVLFKKMYETAYRLGTDAGGLEFFELPEEDLDWLERVRKAEYVFLAAFAKDIINRRGSIAYQHRANMYVESCDGIFQAGRVGAYPEQGTKVQWVLGVAEHCDDCIDLAMRSPFTPKTLPTTPKAGGTQCLSNCRCTLRVRHEAPSAMDLDIKRVSARRKRALGLGALGITTAMLRRASGNGSRVDIDKLRKVIGQTDCVWDNGEKKLWLDWDVVDDLVSVIFEKREARRVLTEGRRMLRTEMLCNEARQVLSVATPSWLDPTIDKDVMIWHGIGITVKEELKKTNPNNIEGRVDNVRI